MRVYHGNEHDTMIKPQEILLINVFLPYIALVIIMSVLLHMHNSIYPDPTMSVDKITQILNNCKIPGSKWEKMMGLGGLGIPRPLLEEIQRRYSTDTEKNHACADYYVNYDPTAEWEHLTGRLYWKKEFPAARESKTLMSTGKFYTIIILNLIQRMEFQF